MLFLLYVEMDLFDLDMFFSVVSILLLALHRCSTLVKLSYAFLVHCLQGMAEPTDPQELAKVQAQDLYNAAAVGIEDLLDDFPNPTWNSTKMDTWLIDAVSHLTTCEQNWSQAGVTSKAWYKLEYSLITRVPNLSMDLVVFSRSEFNELVGRVLDYDPDIMPLPVQHVTSQHTKVTGSPSHPHQNAAATHSRVTTPAPLLLVSKPPTPMPATPKCMPPAMPKPSTSNSGASNEQVAQPSVNNATGAQPQTILKMVKPMPITAGSSDIVFPPDPTLPDCDGPLRVSGTGSAFEAQRHSVYLALS
ncbi:hypothetical protein EDD85DRAFT_795516 [Armillaria nabsnona]|nr:hypothetical protein EDD85DRAFT_795516 [Armillaria nabsnona]